MKAYSVLHYVGGGWDDKEAEIIASYTTKEAADEHAELVGGEVQESEILTEFGSSERHRLLEQRRRHAEMMSRPVNLDRRALAALWAPPIVPPTFHAVITDIRDPEDS